MENRTVAIVTGASGGLGRAFVDLLVGRLATGEIWAIARGEEKLQSLRERYGERIVPIAADLTDRAAVGALARRIEQERVGISYLINNAGYAKFCAYSDINIEESLNMIDLNIGAVVALGLACIPHMPRGAHILNIASQASFQPLPYMNLYSATKAFVRHYTRALNVELREKGITATAVCPGWIDTGLFERGDIGAEKGANRFLHKAQPEKVAAKALADADRNKDMSVYGAYVKCAHAVAKLTPQKRMMKLWLRQQKIKSK